MRRLHLRDRRVWGRMSTLEYKAVYLDKILFNASSTADNDVHHSVFGQVLELLASPS